MVNEDAALLNRRVTHMTPAALFSRRLQKIERMPDGKSMLNFWFEQANTDLYTGKKVELQKF